MARSIHQLIALSACLLLGADAFAAPEGGNTEKKRRKEQNAEQSAEFENVRKALDALTPEQRKRFQENFWRWTNLPPEEKRALRDREETRKKFMVQDVQAAMEEAGLELKGEQKTQFVRRYAQERRKIEEQLRKETMEKRKPMVKEMIARLKAEFSTTELAQPAETTAPADLTAPVAPARP